jgi:hypothetical protein
MSARARLETKRDRELLDVESVIKVMELDWSVEPNEFDTGPDFIVSDANSRFGLEHTLVCTDWSWRSSGSLVRATIAYVENNPVAAGLVERAQDWRWSSARSRSLNR